MAKSFVNGQRYTFPDANRVSSGNPSEISKFIRLAATTQRLPERSVPRSTHHAIKKRSAAARMNTSIATSTRKGVNGCPVPGVEFMTMGIILTATLALNTPKIK